MNKEEEKLKRYFIIRNDYLKEHPEELELMKQFSETDYCLILPDENNSIWVEIIQNYKEWAIKVEFGAENPNIFSLLHRISLINARCGIMDCIMIGDEEDELLVSLDGLTETFSGVSYSHHSFKRIGSIAEFLGIKKDTENKIEDAADAVDTESNVMEESSSPEDEAELLDYSGVQTYSDEDIFGASDDPENADEKLYICEATESFVKELSNFKIHGIDLLEYKDVIFTCIMNVADTMQQETLRFSLHQYLSNSMEETQIEKIVAVLSEHIETLQKAA